MLKSKEFQQFIFKIHSSRILRNDKNLNITLSEAKMNEEVVSLSDGSCLRAIDKIKGIDRENLKKQIKEIKKQINLIKKQPKSVENRAKIKKLYQTLDSLQFKSEYLVIVMDKEKHFDELNKGFKVNGIEYKRLVGTSNGVKKNSIVYVATKNKDGIEIYSELYKRMENDRNTKKELVAGKFESYKSLFCSSGIEVSFPNGILVVDDVTTNFSENVISLDDNNSGDEPVMTFEKQDIKLNNSDGYGLITPTLAERWSNELELGYISSGFCIRNAFTKGMVFPFDFHEFAKRFSKSNIVTDVWGNDIDVNDVECILTTSMLKLWDSYNSLNHYLDCCKKNDYSFSITKACAESLKDERNLNYQFIQSYQLTDEDIYSLISPTISEIKNVLHNDIDKTVLFLGGGLKDTNRLQIEDNLLKALMVDKRLINDPFVINRLNYLIKKKINEAKIGVLKAEGDYSVISGDPFALCQHIFKTNTDSDGNDISAELGLLKSGEIYSEYWKTKQVKEVACFRAPMSCHNNIRKVNISANSEADFWYQYMKTITILNCHDTLTMASNGADCDGDIFLTTNNPVLLKNLRKTLTISCVQKTAEKHIITEDLLVQANKNGFGNAVGAITNKITSMYSVQSQFSSDSEEYKVLDYRISCGQLLQQNEIDRVKGIVAKPMPKCWYDNKENKIKPEDTEEIKAKKQFNSSIVADKKPYFMIYIYPDLKLEYDNYIKSTDKKCQIEFNISLKELQTKPNKTKKEREFLEWYKIKLPVDINPCTMNRLCWIVEKEFNGFTTLLKSNSDFDYNIMKSDIDYNQNDFIKIKEVYKEYTEFLKHYVIEAREKRVDSDEKNMIKSIITEEYKRKCEKICPNKYELCNIILDICYKKEKSKKFAWDICGDTIVENLLSKNNSCITYYFEDDTGSVEYLSKRYRKEIRKTKNVEE